MSKLSFNKKLLEKVKLASHQAINRSLDQHVKLAVTGFSKSGKTAFITSLVHQLTEQADSDNLPFFSVVQENRFVGAKIIEQEMLEIPSFPYQKSWRSLTQPTPEWPTSTNRINTIRLAIKFRPEQGIRGKLTDYTTIYLDIIDYPGEWLMDLTMLDMNFDSWSRHQLQLLNSAPRKKYAEDFLTKLSRIEPNSTLDSEQLKETAESYQQLLKKLKSECELTFLQPGRALIPGDLAGAPIIDFFPLQKSGGDLIEDSTYHILQARFKAYVEQVVKPFYKIHFSKIDRQIVLLDILNALNRGQDYINEQQQAIEALIEQFNYGQSNLIKRLFSPQIDKVLFAANKSDHLLNDQHSQLTRFVNSMIRKASSSLAFLESEIEVMAMSSVRATVPVKIAQNNQQISCLKGNELNSGEEIVVQPGELPKDISDTKSWPDAGFNFYNFQPLSLSESRIPHIRIDHVLNFLLSDKLR